MSYMKTYEKSRKLDNVQKNTARNILLNETWRFETLFSFAFENVVLYETILFYSPHFMILYFTCFLSLITPVVVFFFFNLL